MNPRHAEAKPDLERRPPRLCAQCHGLGTIYDRGGPAIRIDTLRNRVSATIGLLESARFELEDLHVLAYDRPRATSERVTGGDRDYALDNHGDHHAREIYRTFAQVTIDASDLLATHAHDFLRLVRAGEEPDRRIRTRTPGIELALALVHRSKRVKAGDYEPNRTHAQPATDAALDAMKAKADTLEKQNRKLERKVASLQRSLDRKPAA